MDHQIYFDEDSLADAVIAPIRLAGAACVTAAEADRLAYADPDQLQFAAEHQMVVYTANRRDFARLHKEWMGAGRHHAGIIVWTRAKMDIGTQIRALLALLEAIPPEEFVDRIEYLSRWVVLD